MTLVLFVNLEIGARYLLVVSIGLLLLLLGFPLRRPFQMWYKEGASEQMSQLYWHLLVGLYCYCSLEASAASWNFFASNRRIGGCLSSSKHTNMKAWLPVFLFWFGFIYFSWFWMDWCIDTNLDFYDVVSRKPAHCVW